ncbi:hypothetical protein K466DRAFT_270040 [Polyporus arcularius HHB13444]|uniref:Uncharacterized protein n=1 Tax=Polyporus arcularius HHB13444 TaxID=1314778 RepID=A0A5C3Q0M5_9APHY|nr:hypothetical protein K466DRAFT_270040 [Polyporus arcularius HHB13444]
MRPNTQGRARKGRHRIQVPGIKPPRHNRRHILLASCPRTRPPTYVHCAAKTETLGTISMSHSTFVFCFSTSWGAVPFATSFCCHREGRSC